MSDYGQCCRATSKHTFLVNIFCSAQSTSQKLHPHEFPDSREPLQSTHLWHLKIQPHGVIWHTCICNKPNLGICLQPSRHNMEDFPLYLQGVLQLFPATFSAHWQIREFLFNFRIPTEPGIFCCYRDFLTTWWVLPCVFFQLRVRAARIPVHSYNCTQLYESSDKCHLCQLFKPEGSCDSKYTTASTQYKSTI